MERKEVEKLLEEYGTRFGLWAILSGGQEAYQFMDKGGINLKVYSDNSFDFSYIIPGTIFQLTCPRCSPVTNQEHFMKMYRKFRKIVSNEGWGEDE